MLKCFSVQAIGVEKVKQATDLIVKRAEEVTAECFEKNPSTGWISSPIIIKSKRRNQTCHMYVKGLYNNILNIYFEIFNKKNFNTFFFGNAIFFFENFFVLIFWLCWPFWFFCWFKTQLKMLVLKMRSQLYTMLKLGNLLIGEPSWEYVSLFISIRLV